MINQIKIIKNMGISWTIYRAQYELKKKAGLLQRKFIPKPLSNEGFIEGHIQSNQIIVEESLLAYIKKDGPKFFFEQSLDPIKNDLQQILDSASQQKLIRKADKVTENIYSYFSNSEYKYNHVSWHYSPFTDSPSPKDKHWLDISDLNSNFGDIKFIWELSRFSFVYDLVRAYTLTYDDKYVKKYWELVEDWIENNPMEYGVNFKDGQEMSLRVMAWLFGLYAFLYHSETTPSRVTTILKVIYQHFDHIEKHFDFALKSVKNNHTISEAAGLYTVGVLFPFMDKAKQWKETGKKYLEKEAMWQIYDDGSYIQNSMNYHRLMLQDYTWAIRLGELNKDFFSQKLTSRLKKAVMFLYQHQVNSNGRLPNYGMNDGALIHPLSTNDYLDYRPQLDAAWMALTKKKLYPRGTHDENILWLFGSDVLVQDTDSIERKSIEFSKGGYYTFRNSKSFGMTRCTTFKHRPAQADMLHFDLWINDISILADAGTYSYNTEPKYISYFNGTASHNTVMINNKDQMQKGNRFIWLDWTKSKLLKYENHDQHTIFEGEHYGYKPLTHRRGILNVKDHWVIVDDIFGDFYSVSDIQLSWLFGIDSIEQSSSDEWSFFAGKDKYKLKTITLDDIGGKLFNGSEEPFKGWQSLYYGDKQNKPQLILSSKQKENTRFITIITKENSQIELGANFVNIGKLKVELLPIAENNIFANIKDDSKK